MATIAKRECRKGVVACIAVVGFLALCGEPTQGSNFALTILCQMAIAGLCFYTAARLWQKWNLTDEGDDDYETGKK